MVRRLLVRLGWGVAISVAAAALVLAAWAIREFHRDPMPRLDRGVAILRIVSSRESTLKTKSGESRRLLDLEFAGVEPGPLRIAVSLPTGAGASGLPVLVVLGGLEVAARVWLCRLPRTERSRRGSVSPLTDLLVRGRTPAEAPQDPRGDPRRALAGREPPAVATRTELGGPRTGQPSRLQLRSVLRAGDVPCGGGARTRPASARDRVRMRRPAVDLRRERPSSSAPSPVAVGRLLGRSCGDRAALHAPHIAEDTLFLNGCATGRYRSRPRVCFTR